MPDSYYRAYTIIDDKIYWFYYTYEFSIYGNKTYRGESAFRKFTLSTSNNREFKTNFKSLDFLRKCLNEAKEDFDIKYFLKGRETTFHIVKVDFKPVDTFVIEGKNND